MSGKTVALLLLILPSLVTGQKNIVRFKHLTVDDGLSQSTVQCILKDSEGFMWFGTADGLNRYDGYEYKIYKNNPGDSSSISNNSVWSVLEDSEKNLWFGTSSGLNLYHEDTETFTNPFNDTNNGHNLIIRAICEDDSNDIWIGTEGSGLRQLNPRTGAFKIFTHDAADPNTISSGNIRSLLFDLDGNLWIGTFDAGLNLFDRKSKTFKKFRYETNDPNSIASDQINAITQDNDGNIWLGAYGGGLCRVEEKEGRYDFIRYEMEAGNKKGLSPDQILTLFPSQKGVWFGSENGGLHYFDIVSGQFETYYTLLNNPESLNNNSIYSILEDEVGDLWVGTYSGGVNLANKPNQIFHLYKSAPGASGSLSYNSVFDFVEAQDGSIWIATDGGGLNHFNRSTGVYEHFNSQNSNLINDAAISVLEDSRGDIWLGTWAGGLNKLNRKTGSFEIYTKESCGLPTNNIFAIYEDRKGRFWLNCFLEPGGLVLFDRDNGVPAKTYTAQNSGLSSPYFKLITEDVNGNLLIGNQDGLNIFNPDTETFEVIGKNRNLSHSYVMSILEENKDILWLGTQSGLNKYNRKTGEVIHYFEKDGLPNNLIRALEIDNQGNIWIATNRGLSRFDPKSETFRNFGTDEGVQGNEFNTRASYQTKDGWLWFGGVNGFNVFDPVQVKRNTFIPPVVLTDFQIFNKPVSIGKPDSPLPKHISQLDKLTLSYKESVFTFYFSALSFSDPERNQYAYIMEGFEKEWNNAGTDRKATYTNLNPGKYVFRVKASNNHGFWNEEGTSIAIIITPPFWKTWWFRITAGLTLILFAWLIYYKKTREFRKRNDFLEQKIEERTLELADEKNLLQAVINIVPDAIFMKDRNHRFLLSNQAHYRMLGACKHEDAIGKLIIDFFPEQFGNENAEDDRRIIETGVSVINKEQRFEHPTTKEGKWILISKVPFFNDKGKIKAIVGISRDITERKLFEEKLKEAKQQAEDASRSKSEFLANMSHEIRTPMNAIIGMTELALDTVLNSEQHEYLKIVEGSAEGLLGIINDILDFSKIEAGQMELENIPFDLSKCVEEVGDILSLRAHKKGLELVCYIEPGLPKVIYGDPTRLRQILVNLGGNSIKFTHQGEIAMKVVRNEDMDIVSNDGFICLKFMVTDTGVGISKEGQKKIFEKFRQEDGSTTRKFGGTGLGLSICKTLVEMMGGVISVKSEVGKGSIFQFTTLLHAEPDASQEDSKIERFDFSEFTALVIDDNETNRMILEKTITFFGFCVETAEDGLAALKLLKEHPNKFDVIILDHQMPGIDGVETARRIRENLKLVNIKLILLSSFGHITGEKYKKYNFSRSIVKPVKQSKLYEILRDVLTGKFEPEVGQIRKAGDAMIEPWKKDIRILVVEDNPDNQKLASRILEKAGYQMEIADNGKVAVDLVKEKAYDIIFMDVQMPVMDGFQAAEEIRYWEGKMKKAPTPIIALTAFATEGFRERCLLKGMNDYLTKPLKRKVLLDLIETNFKPADFSEVTVVNEEVKQPSPSSQ